MSQVCSVGTDCWGIFSSVEEEEEKKAEAAKSEESKTWDDQRFTKIAIQDNGESEEILSGYVVHIPSSDQYGHRTGADSDLTIRMKMVFLFFTTPLVGTLFAIPLRVAHLCSGRWALTQGYQEALSQWKIERLECYNTGQLDQAPSKLDLYTYVALKSIKYFAEAFVKLATYPLALALCMGAALIAPVSPFWARHAFARIQEAWSIDIHPESRFALGVNHLMNFQAPCMLSKRVWENYNLYERGFDENEPLDQIYNLKQLVLRFEAYFPEKTEGWVKILDDLRNVNSLDIPTLIKIQKEIEQFVSKTDEMIDKLIDKETLSEKMNREEELGDLQNHFDYFATLTKRHELETNKSKSREAIQLAVEQIEPLFENIHKDLRAVQGEGSPGEEIAYRLKAIQKEYDQYADDKSFEKVFQRIYEASEILAHLQSLYESHLESLRDAERKHEASLKEEAVQGGPLYPGGPIISFQKKDGNCWLNMVLNGLRDLNRDPGISQEMLRSWTVDWMEYNYDKDEILREYINEAIDTHKHVGNIRIEKEAENINQMFENELITKGHRVQAFRSLEKEKTKLDEFSLKNYWELMRKNGSYGTRAELYALSRIFSVNIEIWRNRENDLGLTKEFDLPITSPHYLGTIGAVMSARGNHFDLLRQTPEAISSGELSESSENPSQ